ncbi:hypothetical protein BDY24DRAFT_417479 [Mrakia frigida]|uniref:Vps41p n=1 Tax=Mrakia frigida TaxID=29902 RepID=UPI003FCC130F
MAPQPNRHLSQHHSSTPAANPSSPSSASTSQDDQEASEHESDEDDEEEEDDGEASSPSEAGEVVQGDDSGKRLEDAVKDGLVGGIKGEVMEGVGESDGSEEEEEGDEEEEDEEEDDAEDGEDSGSESGSGSDEDDEEEEEEEPVLKYARLGPGATEVLTKDSASAVASSSRFIAVGTHAGMVHILSYSGQKLSSYRAHTASLMAICISDDGSEFIGTASFDGKVVINSLLTPERYSHDFRRPLRSLALEPNFAKRSSKAFVAGGMAGTLSLMEKGWLGGFGGLGTAMGIGGGGSGQHKETVLHEGEGPIWGAVWEKGGLIAWANDLGVKIYDTNSQRLITFIDRPPDSPRADLFKPILLFLPGSSPTEPTTLIIAWADHIKLARIRTRTPSHSRPSSMHHSSTSSPTVPQTSGPTLHVEITAIFQVDCMISGLTVYKTDFLVLAYLPPDEETFKNEATSSREEQRRKAAQRPELRIISRRGEELSSDALSLNSYHLNGCNDYSLVPAVAGGGEKREGMFVVLSPKDVVVARERDGKDRVAWLVERKRYEEALDMVEKMKKDGAVDGEDGSLSVRDIGEKFLESLMQSGDYSKAASLCSKVLGQDKKAWEDWIFLFAQRKQLQAIIPFTPTKDPQLSDLVYEMILAHFLSSDRPALLRIIKEWPPEIYKISSVVNAVEGALAESPREKILMECLAELFVLNRQPGKALPYYLRLRRPNVFDLIRDFNLFTAVRDQALLLVEFDMELNEKTVVEGGENGTEKSAGLDGMAVDGGKTGTGKHGKAIQLLVDHSHSIPIARVINQLEERPKYLFMYLDSLFEKDPHLVSQYGDQHIALCAEFDYPHLMDLLRSSIEYSLEKAYRITKEKDYVPEMVFLLGRMGNSKDALMLIIERLGDVQRAIEFAKEQNDPDLWEDLLRYSENKPRFIRGLLENVGAGIDPVLLIRRIKDGLEIPGLKEALIKILQDFNLQISLLEGCQTVLHTDCSGFSVDLLKGQTHGFLGTPTSTCQVCSLPVFRPPPLPSRGQQVVLVFLCRHVVHATCALEDPSDELPPREEGFKSSLLDSGDKKGRAGGARRNGRSLGAKLSYASSLRVKLPRGCPHCRTAVKNGGLSSWST